MAHTPLQFVSRLLCLCQFVCITLAATVSYDWNITWVRANPDGQFERPTIGINGQWPMPQLRWTKGDRIVASITNQLGNQSTSMHWHGMFQNGTNSMDGASGVTQCGIAPGSTMIYNFTVEQSGTYWYHSHTRAQYPDGLRQMLIVADPDDPLRTKYDAEVAFTLSDWYHDEMPGLTEQFISVSNPTGAEPVPNSALMNDTQNFTVSVEPAKTYLFHLANVGAFAGQFFWIEDHTMQIVEVDGVAVTAAEASMIYLTAAQRYSFLVTTKNGSDANFAMMGSMDTDLFDTLPADLNWNVTGWLVYNETAHKPAAAKLQSFGPFDDATLVPADGLELYDTVDDSIKLDLSMINLDDGANYAAFNNVPYVAPKVPALYTVQSSGSAAANVSIYGSHTNSFVLGKDQTIEIVLNNLDSGKHPFHLHGHNFQIVDRAAENAGPYTSATVAKYPAVPARRDTVMVRPLSYVVLRFKADNPGVWLFHCHINWHMDSGLVATMIETPLALQQQTIPTDHYEICRASDTLTSGNAAGQTGNLFDLSKQSTGPGYLPAGFTARGIVALVFSVLSAFLGMGSVAWYGIKPFKADRSI